MKVSNSVCMVVVALALGTQVQAHQEFLRGGRNLDVEEAPGECCERESVELELNESCQTSCDDDHCLGYRFDTCGTFYLRTVVLNDEEEPVEVDECDLTEVSVIDPIDPSIVCPADEDWVCGVAPTNSPDATATDNCGIDDISAVVQGYPLSCSNRNRPVVWTATDICGNTASCTQTLTYTDAVAPTFTSCPADEVKYCPGTHNAGSASATDNCGATPVVTRDAATVTLNQCGEEKSVNFKATDDCGNENNTCTQKFTFANDHNAPTFSNCPTMPVSLTCGGTYTPPSLTVTDASNCVNDISYTPPSAVSVTCNEVKPVTHTATDSCSNHGTCTYNVQSYTPNPTCSASTTTVPVATCNANWMNTLTLPSFTDHCYSPVNPSNVQRSISNTLSCGGASTATVTFTYTRPGTTCPATASCGYPVSITCSSDTAFGFIANSTYVRNYANTLNNLQNAWGWGSYYASAVDQSFTYTVYAGASCEVAGSCGSLVGTVSVNPVSGASTQNFCSGVTVDNFHLEISKPYTTLEATKPKNQGGLGYQNTNGMYKVGTDAYCKQLRPPGDFTIQTGTKDCTANSPCCVAVHASVNYQSGCTSCT